jgi:hypothetical protein
MIRTLASVRHRAVHHAVTWASTRPRLYYALRAATGTLDGQCVTRATEVVIEGFPRSANSTTVNTFLAWQGRPVAVAHHKHHAAQLLRAVEWQIPAIVLIRRPADAIISLRALAEEGRVRAGATGRGNALTFADVAWAWLCFYRALLPVKASLVVAPFDVVTKALAPTIDRVNARFGTRFRTGAEGGPEERALGWHALPNEVRNRILAQLRTAFAEQATVGRLKPMMAHCDDLYHCFVEGS